MLAALERLSNQLPPRLKALLNLAISIALAAMCVPFLWAGFGGDLPALSLGAGLALLAVFNLFT